MFDHLVRADLIKLRLWCKDDTMVEDGLDQCTDVIREYVVSSTQQGTDFTASHER